MIPNYTTIIIILQDDVDKYIFPTNYKYLLMYK